MAKPEEKLEIVILDEREIVTYPKIGEEARTVVVTYRHGDLPPRTVFIPKAEDTPENRAKIIRQDIQAALAFTPKTLKI